MAGPGETDCSMLTNVMSGNSQAAVGALHPQTMRHPPFDLAADCQIVHSPKMDYRMRCQRIRRGSASPGHSTLHFRLRTLATNSAACAPTSGLRAGQG